MILNYTVFMLKVLNTKVDYVKYNRKELPSNRVKFSSTEGKCQKGYGHLQSKVQPIKR